MKALVVYDSQYGNTEQIARAIAGALPSQGDVRVCRVSEVRPEDLSGVRLLIVGSPTQGFRPTAAVSDFLKGLPANALKGVKAAAFDTRMDTKEINSRVLKLFVGMFGYADAVIAKLLKQKGGELTTAGTGFIVKDKEGPLREGELERAAAWARTMTN